MCSALAKNSLASFFVNTPSQSLSWTRKSARKRSSSRSLNISRTPAVNSLKLSSPLPSTSRASNVLSTISASFSPIFLKHFLSSSLDIAPSRFSSMDLNTLTTRSACVIGSREASSSNNARLTADSLLNCFNGFSCSGDTAPRVFESALNHWCSRHFAMVGLSASENVSVRRQKSRLRSEVLTKFQLGPRLCRASQSLGLRLLAQKGGAPASSSKRTQPMDQTSHLGPKLPIHTSGAMVMGVPPIILPCGSELGNISATPRSMMTTKGSS
mmetsp:Transcript_7085/g.16034  ORF Transcript_7085/g.16034 Transcript_7085/m.16034 type:complete len:270 (+) Transcript_7085:244-1053(+)